MKQIVAIIFLLQTVYTSAQSGKYYHWISLNGKDTSQYKMSKPEAFLSSKSIQRKNRLQISIGMNDIPVNPVFTQTLSLLGVQVTGTSRWMNAILVESKQKKLSDTIRNLPFISSTTYLGERKVLQGVVRKDIHELVETLEAKVNPSKQLEQDSDFYGKSALQVKMLNTPALHQLGFNGKGITVAVLDAGFSKVNHISYFRHLFDSSQIVLTRDLVDGNTQVYDDDAHGTGVLSCMAAYAPNRLVGTAYAANYLLIRTEDALNENLLEEALWILGAELADSAGADLIQSSLGYNEFDDKQQNHRLKELNGNTTLISKGATLAVAKGMVVVCSSGNEGDNNWRKIVAPADVKDVITVGGVDETGNLALFSSIGPTADRRVKPDLVAMGERTMVLSENGIVYPGNGTSYACPLICGTIACLMQACPITGTSAIAQAIKLSSDNYTRPNNYIGYGVPDAAMARAIMDSKDSLDRITQNSLLDARFIDERLHVAYALNSPQKIQLIITDSTGYIVYSDRIKVKQAGIYRASLSKSNHWKKGNYGIQLITLTHSITLYNLHKNQ
ncbi:MAG: S8 family serine peptidase [Bacteroidia bacterium]|jgi:subtilisin family serine protease